MQRRKFIALVGGTTVTGVAGCLGNSDDSGNDSSPTETSTPEPTETETPTPDPTETETPTPDPTETDTPTPEPTETETETPTPEPSDDPFADADGNDFFIKQPINSLFENKGITVNGGREYRGRIQDAELIDEDDEKILQINVTIDEDYGNLRSNVILYGQVIPRGLTRQEADELESIHFDDLKEVWVNPESKDKVLEIPTSVIMNFIESGNHDAYVDQVTRLSRSM